ncbi:hypothetical protein GCM10023156_05030 [Novipirellula rosea]|uniref:Uncharacterized protein n=2 Tax=Novipirellula rosea TaxID=1031540 RepID=A0ABP8M8T7_9BACT
MHFLNPAEALHGEAGILQDSTYLQLKAEMLDELSDVATRISETHKFQPSKRAKKISELIELRSFIFDHHFPEGGKPNLDVLDSTDIEEAFGWGQSTASKKMKVLFRNRIGGGIKAYQKLFGPDKEVNGIRVKLSDETLTVDEIWEDRALYEDDDLDDGTLVA